MLETRRQTTLKQVSAREKVQKLTDELKCAENEFEEASLEDQQLVYLVNTKGLINH
jgi:hypothetical protein